MQFTRKEEGALLEVFDPATDERLGAVPTASLEQARVALTRARAAQPRWEAAGLQARVRLVRRFIDLLLDRSDEVCRLISRENGKVLQEAFEMEVFPVADLADYFARRAARLLAPRPIPLHLLKHRRSYLHYRPRGVVLIISPWNFPFAIPFGEVIMALLAGNAALLKPASLTPLIAAKGRELLLDAGLDPDLLAVLPCPGRVAFELIGPGVDYVNFTGSSEVGQRVAEACGRHLIPCSMELGGKAPAVVLPDANLDLVAGSLVWGAFANAGQICASVERAYLHQDIHDEVVWRVLERVRRLRVGDPLADGSDMGPMTDPAQLAVVQRQVDEAQAQGARLLAGGQRLAGRGRFFPPTVLSEVTDEMAVAREETFGPVLPLLRYRSVEEAIARANRSPYGLTAYVYGRNRTATRRVAERLEAGTVMINEVLFTHAAPETPWQGVKLSGMGRVHSDDGLRDLCTAYHVNEPTLPAPAWSPFWQPYSHGMLSTLQGAARALLHSRPRVRASAAWSALRAGGATWRERRGAA